jgi:hypothetical protein
MNREPSIRNATTNSNHYFQFQFQFQLQGQTVSSALAPLPEHAPVARGVTTATY